MGFRVIFLAFTLSFCSLFYELIFAKALTISTNNLILAQTFALGFYFLGMGIGSHRKLKTNNHISFLKTELILSALGMVSPILIYLISFIFNLYTPSTTNAALLPTLLLIPLIVGFYTGKEFLHLMKMGEVHNVSVNIILATTYLGNLAAGIFFPLYIYQSLGIFGSSLFVASLNLMAALALAFSIKKVSGYLTVILLTVVFYLFSSNIAQISSTLLSLSYTQLSTKDVGPTHFKNIYYFLQKNASKTIQYRSKYQDIDIVSQKNNYTLFLNRKPQFSSNNYKAYHSSMVEGFLNLHSQPIKKVLILGGGDAILAHYLLQKNVNSITLVDLDPFITSLATNNPNFTKINKSSFKNPKVTVINGDAFTHLLKNSNTFDAIFIDFPLPTYLELSKLYSTEFYSLVLKSLAPGGAAIFDSPIHFQFKEQTFKFTSDAQKIIYSTLEASGITNFTGFGPHENFIYFNKANTKKSFDYKRLSGVSGRIFVNFVENDVFLDILPSSKDSVNSIFKPKRFR